MPFQTLPVELQSMILKLVCSSELDKDIPTYLSALNLCLVSRDFYSLVVHCVYRTLLATGRTRTKLLARTLRSRPDLGKYAVNLFVSDRKVGSDDGDTTLEVLPTFAFEYPGTSEARRERLLRMQAWLEAREHTYMTFRNSIQDILEAVSRHLVTLSICMYGHYNRSIDQGIEDALLLHSFPNLRELVVRDNTHPQPCKEPKLPALVRLHLAGGNLPQPFSGLATIIQGSPNLTHIRVTEPFINEEAIKLLKAVFAISETSQATNNGKSAEQLKSAKEREYPRLEFSSRSGSESLETAAATMTTNAPHFTERIERFILTPSPYALFAAGGDVMVLEVLNGLEALKSRIPAFELLAPAFLGRNRKERYPIDEALHDFIECVMNRDGCWQPTQPSRQLSVNSLN